MLVYQRYIAKNILLPFVVITFIITGIVWITQILRLLYLIDKGIRLSQFFGLVILVIPSLLFVVLPFVSILACIYTYNRLSEERQLTILKSCGLSNIKLAIPALLIAGLVTLISYYISAQVLPLSYTKLKSNLNFIKDNYVLNIINEKAFTPISKYITIYINKKTPDGKMLGLILFDNRNNENPAIIFAEYGKLKNYNDTPIFQLYSGSRQAYDNNDNITKLYFDSLIVELTSNKTKKFEQEAYSRDINEYYIQELFNPISELSEQRKKKLLAEGHQRLIWPLYNFVLTFLAMAVFLKQPYNKKSHFKQILLTSIAVVVVTYLHFTFQNLASRDLNFILACYANLLISIIFSIWLFMRRTM
jgi:lipopolysaccharide export system permease protein